ncbi:MAG: MFS transporter [Eggerthellaceae bacterium]|nr:MFS transporter [Eggerthellaceae bacterium]
MGKLKGNPHAWMALIAMCLTALYVGGIGWNCISLYFPPLIEEWGVTRTEVSLVVTILSTIHMVIATFAFGQIASRIGIRKMLVIGGILNTAGFIVMAMANGIPMLYIGAALFGTGIGFTSNSTYNTALTKWFKKNQSTMISLVATTSSVVGIISATVVAAIIASAGWRTGFLITAAIAAVCCIAGFFLYKGEPEKLGELHMYAEEEVVEEAVEEDGVSFKKFLTSAQGWMLIVAWLFIGIAGYVIQGNLALFANDYGYAAHSGTLLSVLLFTCAIFMPIAGRICDKLGSKWMVFIGMGAVVINCAILRFTTPPIAVMYVIAILAGFSWDANIVPVAKSILESSGNKEFSKKTGVLVGMQAFGVALAPTIFNMFYDFGGQTYDVGLIFMAALAIIVMILFIFGTRPIKTK